jgi:putative transposase
MARKKKSVEAVGAVEQAEPLGTIWRVDDGLWAEFAAVQAELDPPSKGHRPRIDQRKALDGVIYHLRTGCQWEALPAEFGDDSSVHRTMQRWVTKGVLRRVWGLLVEACDALGAVEWAWQSFDCAMGKARHGGIKSDRTRPTGRRTAPSAGC